MNTNFLVPRV